MAVAKLEMVGLKAADGDKWPAELSGGMTKRAAMARALALDPEFVFLDEPTSGLDPISAGEVDDMIATLQATLGLTVFMVTHDLESLRTICDRIIVIAEGGIVGRRHHVANAASQTSLGTILFPRPAWRNASPDGRTAIEDRQMEFNARYALTGLFAVAVVVAMFFFVYWLENQGGFGERASYQVRFTVPVTGLSVGSDVLFNGVKVGEVDGVHLDANHPDWLIAGISIAKATPVRTDTAVGIDYQGLTGSANVLLTGGSVDAPRLTRDGGPVPVLDADPGASRSWTQKASRILGRLDDLLAKNSGRFDTILDGLARLAGGGSAKDQPVTHDLLAATDLPKASQQPAWQMTIAEPSVVLSLNTDRILEQVGKAETKPVGNERWADSLPTLLQARLIQSFENAGYQNVLRPAEAPDPDDNLVLDVRKFWLVAGDQPSAIIDIMAKIIDRQGAVVAAKRFTLQGPASGTNEEAAATALNGLFTSMVEQLVPWTVAAL